jgi:uncharacterized phage protein (TIGR01671 family)
MRNMKYKAWSEEYNKIGKVVAIDWCCDKIITCHIDFNGEVEKCYPNYNGYSDPIEFLQFTGLKDIHDKDIYEGDILNISKEYSGSFVPVYVLFNKGQFMVQMIHKLLPPFSLIDNVSLYEIIGNIYENKELLEEN